MIKGKGRSIGNWWDLHAMECYVVIKEGGSCPSTDVNISETDHSVKNTCRRVCITDYCCVGRNKNEYVCKYIDPH